MSKKKKALYLLFLVFTIAFFLLMLSITLPYLSGKYDVDFLLTKQNVLHIDSWRFSFYIHISSSLIVLLLGAFQFSSYVLNKHPRIHRVTGIIYIVTILFLSAPSGLVMAFYANGGIGSKISFIIASLLWWFFTLMAYKQALNKQFKLHQKNMYRSYALTLSAITLRIYVVLMPLLNFYLPAKEAYTLVAWLSWIPNLIIAEIILLKNKL